MVQVTILLLICFFGAWGAGVRFHKDALYEMIIGKASPKVYQKIELNSGGSLVGEILEEDTESVRVKVDGGSLKFMRSEIATMSALDSNAVPQGTLANMLTPPKPVFTIRPEDRLFAKKTTRKAPAGPAAVPQQSSGLAYPVHAQAALDQAKQMQSLAQQKQNQIEAAVREMEEGY